MSTAAHAQRTFSKNIVSRPQPAEPLRLSVPAQVLRQTSIIKFINRFKLNCVQ